MDIQNVKISTVSILDTHTGWIFTEQESIFRF